MSPGGSTVATLNPTCAGKTARSVPVTADLAEAVPAFAISVPAGKTIGTATVLTKVSAQKPRAIATVSAIADGKTVKASLTIESNTIVSASLNKTSIAEGDASNLTVRLAFASNGGQTVQVTSSDSAAIAPVDIAVTNATSATIPIVTNSTRLTAAKAVTLTLQLKDARGALVGGTVTQTITLNPEVVSVTPATATVARGGTVTGQINLFAPFPGADQTITITSTNPAVLIQQGTATSSSGAVTVRRGDTSVPFTLKVAMNAIRGTVVTVMVASPLGYASRTIRVTVM